MISNTIEGMKWGLIMAVLLSTWAAILALLSGTATFRSRGGGSLHVFVIIALYIIGGVSAGALVGSLRPLLRWSIGAIVLGMLAALPFGAGLLSALNGFGVWGRTEFISLIFIAIAFGGAGGLIIRGFVQPRDRESDND